MIIDTPELRQLRDNTKNEHYKTLSVALDKAARELERMRSVLAEIANKSDANCDEAPLIARRALES